MKNTIFILVVLLIGNITWADNKSDIDKNSSDTVYYVGEQINFFGNSKDCFVEAGYSQDGSEVTLRSIVIDAHDPKYIGIDQILAAYSSTEMAYTFSKHLEETSVESLSLKSANPKEPKSLDFILDHEGHLDFILCEDLSEVTEANFSQIREMFEHFADYLEESSDDHSEEGDSFGHQGGHDHSHHKH